MAMNVKIFDKSEQRGTYLIPSNTRVIIGKNVELSSSQCIDDYYVDDSIFGDGSDNGELGRSLLFANGQENIEIEGEEGSVINGKGELWLSPEVKPKRPSLIRLVGCKNVVLKNLNLKNSPCWCIHLHNCENVHVENVNIVSKCNGNNDGIDIDCCRNVRVKNCYIDSGDDAIVLKSTKNIISKNIHISDCTVSSRWAGFKLGTESIGDFKNIIFENSTIVNSKGGTVKIVPVDGSNVEDLQIKNINVESGTGPIFIANGYRMRKYFNGHERTCPGIIKDVTIENFKANVYISEQEEINRGLGVVLITGTPQNKIEKITLKNCKFSMPGGVTDPDKKFELEELTTQYPEFFSLGSAPAYGAFLRHVENVVFDGVEFLQQKPDVRAEIVTEDVLDFTRNP